MNLASQTCAVVWLGTVDYHAAWDLQKRLAAARAADQTPDTLLLLEHPHTYTLGRSGDRAHLLMSAKERARRGVEVVEVDRGGDITYHGPGQLVAYPIRYLGRADPRGHLPAADYVGYLRRLEEVLIDTIGGFGIQGWQEKGYTGLWVDGPDGVAAKIAAIGVRVSAGGVSTHGSALNVTVDLDYFGGIVPCGIEDRPVTSMRALLGDDAPTVRETADAYSAAFGRVFGCEMVPAQLSDVEERH